MAAGSGKRCGGNTPKQFRTICGKPVLVHTVERFLQAGAAVTVVVSAGNEPMVATLLAKHFPDTHFSVVAGGAERFHSVSCGIDTLSNVPDDALVAVHDAVRPLLSPQMIERGYSAAKQFGSAVPVVAVTDSVRQVAADGSSKSLERSSLRAVQTPQIFPIGTLRKAYQQPFSPAFTDDASVVEAMGVKIALYEGETTNLKITYADDLKRATSIMRTQNGCTSSK